MGAAMNPKLFWLFMTILLVFIPQARAQQQAKKIAHIGVLNAVNAPSSHDALLKGLRELGYVEGKNIVIEYRSADGTWNAFPN